MTRVEKYKKQQEEEGATNKILVISTEFSDFTVIENRLGDHALSAGGRDAVMEMLGKHRHKIKVVAIGSLNNELSATIKEISRSGLYRLVQIIKNQEPVKLEGISPNIIRCEPEEVARVVMPMLT